CRRRGVRSRAAAMTMRLPTSGGHHATTEFPRIHGRAQRTRSAGRLRPRLGRRRRRGPRARGRRGRDRHRRPGDITLTMWDQEVRGAQNDAIEALIEAFQDEYPNVTIERNSQSFDDLQQQTGLALSGNDVPDVLQVNNARGDMGTFVADGLLTDL